MKKINPFVVFVALAAAVLAPVTRAKTLSLPDEPVYVAVQDKSLKQFLTDFFAALGVSLNLSDGVHGTISGEFEAAPSEIFDDVTFAYGLVPYFDGTTLHIAMQDELLSETLTVAPVHIDDVVRTIVARDLVDERQTVRAKSQTGVLQVRGSPQFVADVRALVRKVSAPTPRRAVPTAPAPQAPPPLVATAPGPLIFRTFDLKYASAADVVFLQNNREVVLPGVATLLRNMVGDGYSPTTVGRVYGAPRSGSRPKLRGRGLRRFDIDDAPAQAGEQGMVVAAETERVSRVRIEAEPNLNAVIVRDYVDAMPLYASLIERLDVEPSLIEIKVTIIDVDANRLHDLGVNWRYDSNDTSALFGGGEVLQQDGGLILNTVVGSARKFFANVNALAENGSADVVSRPQIVTVNNLEAVLANDQTFFVRVAGEEEVDLFDVSVGTSLRVLPNVVGDRDDPKIRLLVTIEDGSIDAEASVDDIPVIERSSLTTQAIIFDGESLLIGGLERDATRENSRQVPVLGKLPAVGRLFRRDTRTRVDSERLFLISPRVITAGRSARSPLIKPSATSTAATRQAPTMRSVTPVASEYLDGF